MAAKVDRQTVDLSGYPDLVVIYLGMRVNVLFGVRTVLKLGPQIRKSWQAEPDGLLLHEDIVYSLRHIGMRQYWRDFDALEKWARSDPHKQWWREFMRDSGGTGFWHETYMMRGGMEAVYADMKVPLGLSTFAPTQPARGAMFSARRRASLGDTPAETPDSIYSESELYTG